MKKTIVPVILLVSTLLAGVYFGGVIYHKNKFLSNAYVNDINIGRMTLKKANKELGKSDVWDDITIKSDIENFLTIKAEEIDYQYIGSPGLPELFEEQNEWKWFSALFKDSVYTTPISSDYNKDKVKTMVDSITALDKELVNAKLAYSESADAFVIEPHSYQINLTREQLFDLVAEGIETRDKEVNIKTDIEQPTIFEDDESLILARNKANQYLNIELRYDFGDREEWVDRTLMKNWITFDENEVAMDEEKVREYVVALAKKYDTYGRSRKFKTSTGKNITTNGGTYGWVTHRGKTTAELIEHIEAGESKTIEPVYSYKALIRNADDLGNSYLEIDLEQQMVYVYIDGVLQVETQTVTGNIARGFDTPVGVYPLNYKERDAVLKGEDYASPVQYWMPFNGNIGLHDADWRTSFGGHIYEDKGSNGCVNLPPENTKTIFDLVYPGMPVVVH